MQQRCHHTSASARSPSWQPMPRPRLQWAATVRREKVQLRIREQSFFYHHHLSPLNSLLWYVPSSRYMELGSSFLFLQEQIKDIIIICVCLVRTGHGYLFGFICSCKCSGHPKDLPLWTAGRHLLLGWLFDRRNYPPGVDFFHTGVRRRKYKLGQTKWRRSLYELRRRLRQVGEA